MVIICTIRLSIAQIKSHLCIFFGELIVLTTPMAIAFEAIISTVASLVAMFMVIIILGADDDMANELQGDPKKAMQDFAMKYQALFILYVFINSFVVAAVTEEMVKYFGYWMVLCPDLLPKNRLAPTSQESVTTYNTTNDNTDEENTVPASARSHGAGITVAMVSVALGFACCENLMYIFVYSPPSFGIGK